jgi:hypothetical protein
MCRPKKTALGPFLEVDAEDHAEGGSEDNCKGYICKNLTGSAFHGYSSNAASAAFFVTPNARPEYIPSIRRVAIQPWRPLKVTFSNL